jgi:hypothetical protein
MPVKRVVAINVLIFVVLLALVEAGGQAYSRWTEGAFLPERYARYRRDVDAQTTVFERHPYLVARPRSGARIGRENASVTTTAAHTRVTGAAPPKPGAITIALVGGSTTFGTKVTDADTWPWQLQSKLGDGYQVLNFGVPGYTTAEAIIQMALIVPEHAPRVVVFYEGWNDIRNYHWPGLTADYYGHGMTQFDTLLPPPTDRTTFWDRAAHNSFVIGLLNRALGTPVGAQALISDRNDPEVDRIFQRNLQTLQALARRFGMTALFVPQVMNDSNFSKTGVSRSWTPYIEDAAMPRLVKGLNQIMAGVCAPDDTQCQFVGEVLNVAWDGNDFIDEGHLSGKGGAKLASIVEARIRRIAATSPSAVP